MRSRHSILALSFVAVLFGFGDARAQPLGTVVFQLQPHCNRVTLSVVQNGGIFALNGFDDQCGGTTQASVTGTAFPNVDGTIGIGISIVATPSGNPTHVDASIDLATLNGSWRDSAGNTGTFLFNGPGGGSPRPIHARSGPLELRAIEFTLPELQFTGRGLTPNLLSLRSGGTPNGLAATLTGDILFQIESAGYNGAAFTAPRVGITMEARENWSASANGTTLKFSTTANGSTALTERMTVDHNGNVGIGTTVPTERLEVEGDIRIGTGVTGCVLDANATIIAGVCSSDVRFKRDITAIEPALSKVARLQPVRFHWRVAEFPAKHFGDRESLGLVAQDVEQVLPELVVSDADGYKAVNYSRLPLLTIQAVKELKAENDQLKEQNAALERRLAAIEARLPNR